MKNNKRFIYEFEFNSMLCGLSTGKLIAANETELIEKFKIHFMGQFIKVLKETEINELPTIQRKNKRKNNKANDGTGNKLLF